MAFAVAAATAGRLWRCCCGDRRSQAIDFRKDSDNRFLGELRFLPSRRNPSVRKLCFWQDRISEVTYAVNCPTVNPARNQTGPGILQRIRHS
jgi:hypothetical protein